MKQFFWTFLLSCLFIANYPEASAKEAEQATDFAAVLEDSRLWDTFDTTPGKASPLGAGNPDFLWGTATCTLQDSGTDAEDGCPNSQWSDWEQLVVEEDNCAGKSAHLFYLYRTDPHTIISRLKTLGLNSYRFSIEWSHIEPEQGQYDQEKLQVYVDFCKALRNAKITPMVSLHHFSEPKWFHEKGSFEKDENIQDFISFSEYVFPALTQNYRGKPLVDYFCTINEPAIEAFSRYIRGAFSPGYYCDFAGAGNFLYGALKAHCIAYQKLKAIQPNVQIGIVHQYLSFIPTYAPISAVTGYLSLLVNEVSLNFYRTGAFDLQIPYFCDIHKDIREEGLAFETDFVGLQYYTRPVIGFTGSTSYYEPMTEMPFREDPAGIYEAIIETHKAAQRPIIITESGISTHDPKQRSRYMERVLFAARKAQQVIGNENLTGYYLWSFCSNFEWDMGMNPQSFGAYLLNGDGSLAERPRDGMDSFMNVIQAWKWSYLQARYTLESTN